MRGQWKKNEVGKYNYNTESRLYVFVLEYRYITEKKYVNSNALSN